MDTKTIIVVVGICGVTIIEVCALLKGVNGAMMAGSVGAICAIVGGAVGFKLNAPKA